MAISPDSFVGKQVDQFRLEQFISKGSMGVVYKARDTILNRVVAIKLISRVDDLVPVMSESRRRLMQEAQAAGMLNHPNIVTIYAYGETDEFQYISMEYVSGKTLTEILNEEQVLDINVSLKICEQVLLALEKAHQEVIVHRDIKPSNIMITNDNLVKVMDFGIAKLPSLSMTVTGTVLGTPYYMSPEQITGQKVDIRSDLFSVGVVLYQILTGQRPFEGKNTASLAYKITNAEPVPPTVLNVHIPNFIGNIITKSIAKDPMQRYQTPTEMLVDIRKALKGDWGPADVRSDGSAVAVGGAQDPDATVKMAEPATGQSAAAESSVAVAKKSTPLSMIAAGLALLVVLGVGGFFGIRWVNQKSTNTVSQSNVAPVDQKEKITPKEITPKPSVEPLIAQAREQWESNPANARKLLEQAIAQEPNNLDAVLLLARLLTSINETSAAAMRYEDALHLNPKLIEAYCALGKIEMKRENWDQAIAQYESCLNLGPSNRDEVLTSLGMCYLKKNNVDRAKELFQQAIQSNPKNEIATSYLSSLTQRDKQSSVSIDTGNISTKQRQGTSQSGLDIQPTTNLKGSRDQAVSDGITIPDSIKHGTPGPGPKPDITKPDGMSSVNPPKSSQQMNIDLGPAPSK